MKITFRLALLFAVVPTLVLAIYAPIPEQEQGKPLTYRLGASAYYDSNIFGAPTNEIDSMVYNFNAAINFNGSLNDQTFASASYDLSDDYVVDRPTKKNLLSHLFMARLAHAFSSVSNLDVSGLYHISENPQALSPLNQPLNTDQSLKRGEFDARYTTAIGQKTGVVVKYRFMDFSYDNAALAALLDHTENLAGLELSYALLPETKLVGEYRYQAIDYDTSTPPKDKRSNFLMAGVDYNPGKQLLVSARGGFEDRKRDAAPDTTAPYVELTSRYNYAEGSFLATGYTYSLEEPSDTFNYTDSKVNTFFANVQHRLTGPLTASASLTYAPAQLQGRPGVHGDIDETTTRLGFGLSWQSGRNWTVAVTYDLDDITSDDPSREQNRSRFGASARFTF